MSAETAGATDNSETKSLLTRQNLNEHADRVIDELEEPAPGGVFANIPLKAFLLAAAGNFFEYYDFGLLGYFTDEVGAAFFPDGSDELYTLEVFTIFAVGFIFRPFGGAVFGYIADKMGRAKALQLAILMMSLPTFLTGCIPTYDMIGWGAPILLCILRILQGLSQGGEVSSSYVFVYEVAPRNNKAFFLSMMSCSSFGSLLASLMHVIMAAVCTESQLYSWGWRIPFYFGILLALLAVWAKKELKENDNYQNAQEKIKTGDASQTSINMASFENPLYVAFMQHFDVIVLFFFGGAYQHAANYIVWTFLPDYIADSDMHNGYSNPYAYVINCINIVLTIPVTLLSGWYADKFRRLGYGRNSPITLYFGYCVTILIMPLLWYLLALSSNPWTDWLCQLLIGLHFQIVWGSIYFWYISTLLPEQQTRVSLYGVGYNIGAAVFSGTASLIATALVDVLGSILGAVTTGLWLAALGVLGLLTVAYVDFWWDFGTSHGDHVQMTMVDHDEHHEPTGSIKTPNNDINHHEADDTIVAV